MIGKTPHELDLTGTDGGMHARMAQSLREAARYIETHPDLPIPDSAEIQYFVPAADDKAGEDETFRIAAILGASVSGNDFTETRLSFGPVTYKATYLTQAAKDEYSAHMAPYYAARIARRELGDAA